MDVKVESTDGKYKFKVYVFKWVDCEDCDYQSELEFEQKIELISWIQIVWFKVSWRVCEQQPLAARVAGFTQCWLSLARTRQIAGQIFHSLETFRMIKNVS